MEGHFCCEHKLKPFFLILRHTFPQVFLCNANTHLDREVMINCQEGRGGEVSEQLHSSAAVPRLPRTRTHSHKSTIDKNKRVSPTSAHYSQLLSLSLAFLSLPFLTCWHDHGGLRWLLVMQDYLLPHLHARQRSAGAWGLCKDGLKSISKKVCLSDKWGGKQNQHAPSTMTCCAFERDVAHPNSFLFFFSPSLLICVHPHQMHVTN